MSETKNTGDKTLSVERKKTLSLRRGVEQGTVRQSFSHGRSKAVVVEKKKRRVVVPGSPEARAQEAAAQEAAAQEAAAQEAAEAKAAEAKAAEEKAAQEAAEAQAAEAKAAEEAKAEAVPAPEAAPAADQAPEAEAKAAPAPEAEAAEQAPTETAAKETEAPKAAAPEARAPDAAPKQPASEPAARQTARPAEKPAPQRSGGRDAGGRAEPRRDGGQGGRGGGRGQQVHRTLTDAEARARAAALAEARSREADDKRRAEEEVRKEREELERIRREQAEEAERARLEEEARIKAEAEEARRAEDEKATASAAAAEPSEAERGERRSGKADEAASSKRKTQAEIDDEEAEKAKAKRARAAPSKPTPKGDDRRRTKLTITTALEDDDERGRSLAAMRRRREKEKRAAQSGPREKIVREVILPETITIQELASRMAERGVDVIKLLMKSGQMHKITDVIDADTAELVANEMGHTVKRVSESDVEEGLFDQPDTDGALEPRAPVVTIMGHVDHGKTSLLDALRKANVVSGEAGGITQHIGAYQVEQNGQKITFLDTPGHEAFTAMRARGATATDIVVLVVAADDGVMPQTIEAIHHARAAGVPLIVAVNKIDKPGADPSRVRTELLQHEIVVESMGGDTLEVEVSALKHTNLDKLLDAIILQSEVLELKANPDRDAEGIVIEAQLDRGRGTVATVLVHRGTLKVGDILIAGSEWGRVRALINDVGQQVSEAGPSMPVEVLGLQGTPHAGDRFAVVENEARAREISEYRQRVRREKASAKPMARGSLEQMMSDLKAAGTAEFPLVIKGDVQGSVEAIIGSLEKLNTDEVAARVIHSGVGAITESDVTLAEASGAAIIGFNVRANPQARQASDRNGIEIRYYNIIYNLVDDVKAAMSGMLSPERRETFLGNAEILEVFNITKVGKVAGCRVTEGMVERGASVRLLRDNVVIHEGKLSTLKRFKDEVKEVQVGQECGMAFENYQDIRQGDLIECYRVEEIARTL
ncbi:translation initiation factor IF-2 [Amorphus orientalis]|uniref:Translation initiation factor IF-2 n=1 Tax=Amorphus orientalis TaxID=649198 RepID=A0AAE3VN18_9HYPH|nr:translation initiation factor IF-2 [Amorphus orientalis]MDQ0314676.1 translation initiation factor IF-2 [Amorphus orientalis]